MSAQTPHNEPQGAVILWAVLGSGSYLKWRGGDSKNDSMSQ